MRRCGVGEAVMLRGRSEAEHIPGENWTVPVGRADMPGLMVSCVNFSLSMRQSILTEAGASLLDLGPDILARNSMT